MQRDDVASPEVTLVPVPLRILLAPCEPEPALLEPPRLLAGSVAPLRIPVGPTAGASTGRCVPRLRLTRAESEAATSHPCSVIVLARDIR